MRAALKRGEDGPVDRLGMLLFAEDHGAARPAQRLVRRRRDDVRVRRGVRVDAGDDQAGDVGDVGEEVGVYFAGDLAEGGEVELARVRRCARDDNPRALFLRQLAHLVVVDQVRRLVDDVLNGGVKARREVDAPAVSEVAAVRQAHPHDLIARLQQRIVGGEVGRRAGIRLYVGVLYAEEGLRPVLHQRLELVDVELAFVVALAGIALRVFVREDRAAGFQDGLRHVVLGRDQADRILLVSLFFSDQSEDLGIGVTQG